jgi:hypothetical protein
VLYLLDANYSITANNTYYGIDQVPEFWEWLRYQGETGNVKIPLEIIEEMKQGRTENDLLYDWICRPEIEQALLLDEEVDAALVQHVVTTGYAADLTDSEVEYIGRDPFLVAYALVNSSQRCVVTTGSIKAVQDQTESALARCVRIAGRAMPRPVRSQPCARFPHGLETLNVFPFPAIS